MNTTLRHMLASATVLMALVATPAIAADPLTVCVLYFDNNTGDAQYDALRKGLADMMVTDLTNVSGVTVVERSKLESLLGELDLQRTERFDAATAQRVGKLVGARYAVTGAISAISPDVRLDVRLIEVETAKVAVADRVVGKADQFFQLQSDLTGVFVRGLNRTFDKGDTGSRVERLDTLLRFGEALDSADKGDDAEASKMLSQLVRTAPHFKLAQVRYGEVMKRLYAAKKTRGDQLVEGFKGILERADKTLAAGVAKVASSTRKRQQFIGYRVVRGRLYLALIRKATGAKSAIFATKIPQEHAKSVVKWMLAYHDNQRALIDELAELGRKRIPAFPKVPEADHQLATELGLGPFPANYAFLSPQVVARQLATFIVEGTPGIASAVPLKVSPALAELDPKWADKATALLDLALEDITKNDKRFTEREMIRTLDLYGDLLGKLGRWAEAIAKWQQIMDDYPRSEGFVPAEKKVREALKNL